MHESFISSKLILSHFNLLLCHILPDTLFQKIPIARKLLKKTFPKITFGILLPSYARPKTTHPSLTIEKLRPEKFF